MSAKFLNIISMFWTQILKELSIIEAEAKIPGASKKFLLSMKFYP